MGALYIEVYLQQRAGSWAMKEVGLGRLRSCVERLPFFLIMRETSGDPLL